MEYRTLMEEEITLELFSHFQGHQTVGKCWRRDKDGFWCIKEDPFIDDWSKEDYIFLVDCLQNTIRTDGIVIGAFYQNELKGFVSVESDFIGEKKEYLDLTSIHVSEDMRGKGIGKELFSRATCWAKARGGKNYIFLPILPWKLNLSTVIWDALTLQNIKNLMWSKSHMTYRWSSYYER